MERLTHPEEKGNRCVGFRSGFLLSIAHFVLITGCIFFISSCKKLVSISDPTDKIVTNAVFSTDELADAAMNGVYKGMVTSFPKGIPTLFGALSADEVVSRDISDINSVINTNHISVIRGADGGTAPTDRLWSSAYGVVYNANAVLEGIASSTATLLRDSVRKSLTAEAKFVRAFCYFYLTNFYGDVPLVLGTDYNATIATARKPQSEVYQQIIQDLQDAEAGLPSDYSVGGDTRVRANRWTAAALLARVYLFVGDYTNAAAEATKVIDHSELYALENDLNSVFLITSKESIWQLNQIIGPQSNDATPDGANFSGGGADTTSLSYTLSSQLWEAFEPGDARRSAWTDSTIQYETTITLRYAYKYKSTGVVGAQPTQYYVMFRLAELYLIRAEAEANGGGDGGSAAIGDLNIIRTRAALPPLDGSLSQADLIAAVAHEWQIEFFCEGGLRWLNLKRTGRAHDVLSAIPLKQPWAGDYQLLYPIPDQDIAKDNNLTQNDGY